MKINLFCITLYLLTGLCKGNSKFYNTKFCYSILSAIYFVKNNKLVYYFIRFDQDRLFF